MTNPAQQQTLARINKRYRALLPELLAEAKRCDEWFGGLSPRDELKKSREGRREVA